MSAPNDPLFSEQWHLSNPVSGEYDLNVVDVWDDYIGRGVVIAVVDDGVQATHPDLILNYNSDKDYDLVNNSETIILGPETELGAGDGDFHGTAVAGLIAATANNGIGVAGVAYGGELFGIKVGDDISQALELVSGGLFIGGVDRTADVVNLSLGTLDSFNYFGSDQPSVESAIVMAVGTQIGRDGKGIIYVKSAGNERQEDTSGIELVTETSVAAWNATMHSISVAAVQRSGEIDDYSTPGSSVLVSAFGTPIPGPITVDVSGEAPNGGYSPDSDYTDQFNGTSAAAPQVSGVVALMLEANPDLGWRDVQSILAYSAEHVGVEVGEGIGGFERNEYAFNGADTWNGGGLHFSRDYGFGLVDAKAAVRLAETWGSAPATTANQVIAQIDLLDEFLTVSGNGLSTNLSGVADGNVEIEHVQLIVAFEQWFDVADLEISIIAPDGTSSVVLDNVSDDNDEDDSEFIFQWDYFYTNAFRGMDSDGLWTVQFTDQDSAVTSPIELANVELNFFGATQSTDDIYVFTEAFDDYVSRPSHSNVFDGGDGVDTLNAAAVNAGSVVNLEEGTGRIEGVEISLTAIENVYTGDGDDVVTGDEQGNVFFTGRGNDVVHGGDGVDTAKFLAAKSNFSVVIQSDGNIIVSDRNSSEGSDTLTNVEILSFDDSVLDLRDFSSTSQLNGSQLEELAEMYAAYFNRAPDAVGLYFWADKLAEGLKLSQAAELFFDQDETRALYTDPSNVDEFVTSVYLNVLGRAPDADGFAFWKGVLERGEVSQGTFVLEIIGGAKNGGSLADVQYLSQKTDLGLYFSAIRGMSDTDDAKSVFQTFGDASTSALSSARDEVDRHFQEATAPENSDFLFSVAGVVDDPFAIA